jgi:hypothetical protein
MVDDRIKKMVDELYIGIDYSSIQGLYVLPLGILEELVPCEIDGYDLEKPKETLDNLLMVKHIYDRRNIVSDQLESEISNFKMMIRDKRLSIILSKNAAE